MYLIMCSIQDHCKNQNCTNVTWLVVFFFLSSDLYIPYTNMIKNVTCSCNIYLQINYYHLTSIREPSDWMILMTTIIGMQIIEASARAQPNPIDQSGYL